MLGQAIVYPVNSSQTPSSELCSFIFPLFSVYASTNQIIWQMGKTFIKPTNLALCWCPALLHRRPCSAYRHLETRFPGAVSAPHVTKRDEIQGNSRIPWLRIYSPDQKSVSRQEIDKYGGFPAGNTGNPAASEPKSRRCRLRPRSPNRRNRRRRTQCRHRGRRRRSPPSR